MSCAKEAPDEPQRWLGVDGWDCEGKDVEQVRALRTRSSRLAQRGCPVCRPPPPSHQRQHTHPCAPHPPYPPYRVSVVCPSIPGSCGRSRFNPSAVPPCSTLALPLPSLAPPSQCDLYHTDATPYESLLVGQLSILYPTLPPSARAHSSSLHAPAAAPTPTAADVHSNCKTSAVHVAFSRDGFHWSRADASERRPRLPLVDDAHGLRYQQPIAGNLVVVGDELYVYYGGAAACRMCNANPQRTVGGFVKSPRFCTAGDAARDGLITPTNSSLTEVTALAVLRRDGFASLSAPDGVRRALVRTRPLTLSRAAETRAEVGGAGAYYLFVNADTSDGELQVHADPVRVETARSPSAGATSAASASPAAAAASATSRAASSHVRLTSRPMVGVNGTRVAVDWAGAGGSAGSSVSEPVQPHARHGSGAAGSFASLVGSRMPFTLTFVLSGRARLYAFWVSTSPLGESGGHIQGPGVRGGVDSPTASSSSRCGARSCAAL